MKVFFRHPKKIRFKGICLEKREERNFTFKEESLEQILTIRICDTANTNTYNL